MCRQQSGGLRNGSCLKYACHVVVFVSIVRLTNLFPASRACVSVQRYKLALGALVTM